MQDRRLYLCLKYNRYRLRHWWVSIYLMLNVQSKFYAGNPLGISGNYDRLPMAPYFLRALLGKLLICG